MYRKTLYLFHALFLLSNLSAQKHDYTWLLMPLGSRYDNVPWSPQAVMPLSGWATCRKVG